MRLISFGVLWIPVLHIRGSSLGANSSNASKGSSANSGIEAARSLEVSEVGRDLGNSLRSAMAKNFSDFGADAAKNLNFDNFAVNAAEVFSSAVVNAAEVFSAAVVDAAKVVSVSMIVSAMMVVSGTFMVQALPHLPPK